MPSRNPGEAIASRLLSSEVVTALSIGTRITPKVPDQEPDGDYLVFRRVAGGGGTNLHGARGLQNYLYRLDAYCATDEAAEAVLAAVRDRLCGNSRAGIPVWRDLADGVQCCLPADDLDADVEGDGSAVNGFTISIHFCPQP